MQAITYTAVRQNFAKKMGKVCNGRCPMMMTRELKSPGSFNKFSDDTVFSLNFTNKTIIMSHSDY